MRCMLLVAALLAATPASARLPAADHLTQSACAEARKDLRKASKAQRALHFSTLRLLLISWRAGEDYYFQSRALLDRTQAAKQAERHLCRYRS